MQQFLYSMVILLATFSKSEFYTTLQKGSQSEINSLQQKIASQKKSTDQQAYLGAVKMKCADFEKTAGDKLKLFKEGKALLEASIAAEPTNAEYRFLRLIIQEHAPKVLKYNQNIHEDAKIIKEGAGKLAPDVKSAAVNYSKTSANLQL